MKTLEQIADDATDQIGAETHAEWERIRGIVAQAIYDYRRQLSATPGPSWNRIEAELWQRRDYDDGSGSREWARAGVEFTGHIEDLRTAAAAYRAWMYQETGKWWEFEFREKPKPIRSRENRVLQEFRETLEGIIDPNTAREAAWWLQLMEWDPEMDSPWYWGHILSNEVTREEIEQAKRVLTRIRNLARE